MSDIAIKVSNLSKTFKLPNEKARSVKSAIVNFWRRDRGYEIQQALKDVSFEVKKGEFFGIVGRNGSGKSTLLKTMAGIYTPSSGGVKVYGSLTPFIELGVGFNPELTGRENVYLNGALLGFNRKQVTAMYDEIVEFAELEKFMNQKLKNFSSGMQVRLAFSIAIRAKGDILLLDEVLAVGDTAFQRKCLDFFKEIKKTDKTIVLVTHNMVTIEEYCDRAMMIEDSRIVAIGDPMKISAQYEIANSSSNGGKEKRLRPKEPEIKIEEVSVGTPKETKTEFDLEDEVVIDVLLKINVVRIFQVSLALHNMEGEYVAGITSKKDLPNFKPAKGLQKLSCRIGAGQFPSGAYRLVVNASTDEDNPKMIDVASADYGVEMPLIHFKEKSIYKKGIFYMDAEWRHDR